MSVYKQKDRDAWTYEFMYHKRVYKGSTGQLDQADAEAFELEVKRKVRRQVGGILDPRDSPHFQEWGGVYYTWELKRKKVKRPERIDDLIRVVLRFFGRRPPPHVRLSAKEAALVEGQPFHDLQLTDIIAEPRWLDDFERWMERRGVAGQTRNHYRSTVSGMFRVALLPQYRQVTGITFNPMVGVPRDSGVRRNLELEPADLLRWIGHAPYHIRLAMAIAALAPKLRKENVLALEWHVHLNQERTRITIADHKTDQSTGSPIVQLVSGQLQDILADARAANPRGRYVVSYRGKRVHDIRDAVETAATRAGLIYGQRRPKGVTFHSVRHAISTLLASLEGDEAVSEKVRADLLSHTIQTAQGYTNLRPMHERRPLELISARLPLRAIVAGELAGGSDDGASKNTPDLAQATGTTDTTGTPSTRGDKGS